ncbi:MULTISPECIES: branched-chain amino acid ABC transporter permease [unclassified Microbacterium]|uniref:branched-chain amino acid ABC transporter permease n=1 Tax=unclassified Microbacterium TaxID=2609290 RepID=UPI000D565D97|nr:MULTISPECIES: branched-chain amino acid ABC transporter permease [unclassified Microbacterium]PVW03348.1 branched-chain amino acid ABC transporter permease [Microbacterium sp. Gd 4-13]RKT36213.1 amino acid/amide ABC transporter membrane protein 2 (HAAT family) [Microbacterium sp. AG1240]
MDWLQILSNTASSILSPATLGYALAALGLAVHFGYGGLINMGIAGFMAIGAYGYAISVLSFGLPWWLAALIGLVASAVFALILGIPTLRLRGDYLAIVTIAAAEVVRLLFLTTAFEDVTGSADGLSGYHESFRSSNPIPAGTYGFGPFTYNETDWWVRITGLVTLAIAALVVWMVTRSPWGRVLKGIREDEDAVRSLGKNVFSYKLQALVLGGVLAAAGGIVYALPSAVSPGVYVTSLTFFVWTALLLGGAATVFGPLLGSLIFWVLQTFLSNVLPALVSAGVLPFMSEIQAGTVRFILVGVALMLLVIFMPQGILGNKKELTFVK